MININEYLLGKGKTKKYNVKKPEKGCEPQDIIDWLDSFGVDNWYSDHSTLEYPEKGRVGYHIMNGSWGNKLVALDIAMSEFIRQSICVYPKFDNSYISWGFGRQDKNISFDIGLKLMEQIMENPAEAKILKKDEI